MNTLAPSGEKTIELRGYTDSITSAVFSMDGMRVVTASNDSTARIWDAHNGMQILVMNGHDCVVSAIFSPDGTRIITGIYNAAPIIWDAHTGKQIAELTADIFFGFGVSLSIGRGPMGYSPRVQSAAFSRDGTRILTTASGDGMAVIWDAYTGKLLVALDEQERSVRSAVFSPDGKRIVTTSADGTPAIWLISISEIIKKMNNKVEDLSREEKAKYGIETK